MSKKQIAAPNARRNSMKVANLFYVLVLSLAIIPAELVRAADFPAVITDNATGDEPAIETGVKYTTDPAFDNPPDTTGRRLIDRDLPYNNWNNVTGMNIPALRSPSIFQRITASTDSQSCFANRGSPLGRVQFGGDQGRSVDRRGRHYAQGRLERIKDRRPGVGRYARPRFQNSTNRSGTSARSKRGVCPWTIPTPG